MSSQPPDGSSADRLAELLRSIASLPGANPIDTSKLYSSPGKAGEVLELLSQSMLTVAASGFRYWAHVAELCGVAVPVLASMLKDGSTRSADDPEFQLKMLDSLRGLLRDFAELPLAESRRLQADLQRLVAKYPVGTTPTPAAPDAQPYWRRWEVKP